MYIWATFTGPGRKKKTNNKKPQKPNHMHHMHFQRLVRMVQLDYPFSSPGPTDTSSNQPNQVNSPDPSLYILCNPEQKDEFLDSLKPPKLNQEKSILKRKFQIKTVIKKIKSRYSPGLYDFSLKEKVQRIISKLFFLKNRKANTQSILWANNTHTYTNTHKEQLAHVHKHIKDK